MQTPKHMYVTDDTTLRLSLSLSPFINHLSLSPSLSLFRSLARSLARPHLYETGIIVPDDCVLISTPQSGTRMEENTVTCWNIKGANIKCVSVLPILSLCAWHGCQCYKLLCGCTFPLQSVAGEHFALRSVANKHFALQSVKVCYDVRLTQECSTATDPGAKLTAKKGGGRCFRLHLQFNMQR